MRYLFIGKLCGYICPERPEPLANVKVRLYRSRADQKVAAMATARPKETFQLLDARALDTKTGHLLAEASADENGRFEVELGDNQDYAGEAFELDVLLDRVPGGEPGEPLQFTVTMLQPRWMESDNGLVAKWEYCLPARIWCGVRARFGSWVICGRVLTCDTKPQAPVAGVRVRAFDVDIVQDDPLGDALTDATGRFRIDYTTKVFRQTPFSPLIDVEWIGGPDVYFQVETPTGSPLLIEPSSRGRDPDRENAGHCLCVTLCLKDVPDQQQPPTIPLFTHVGQYKVDSDPTASDFNADGTSKAGGYAFTGDIPLIGVLPDGTAADPVEYRFRYAKHPGLTPVENAVAGIIKPTVIGQLEYFAWNSLLSVWELKAADYWVNNPGAHVMIPQDGSADLMVPLNKDIGADGWIEVPTENQLFHNGVGRFVPAGFSRLAIIDTKKLTDESVDLSTGAPPLPVKAGDTVPAAYRSEAPTFRIYFEARKVGETTLMSSNQLDTIALSNTSYTYERHPGWAGGTVTTAAVVSLDIAEMIGPGATGCDTLSTDLHALFTVYHPYLGDARLYFEGNSPLPPSYTASITAGEALGAPPGQLFDISGLAPCAYILWLRATLNLTSGWGQIPVPWIWDKIAFCISESEEEGE